MRLIDADVLMEEVNREIREYMLTEKGICSLIRNAPTIDAVEVVRCRDCRWYDKGENEVSTWSICTRPMGIKDSVTDADYCSFVGCREESEVE